MEARGLDKAIANWVANTFKDNKPFVVFEHIVTWGGTVWVIVALIILLLIFKKTRKIGVCATMACLLTFLINHFILKPTIMRPRPFVEDSDLTVLCELAGMDLPTGYSMPSGHAAVTAALAVSIMLYSWKLGIPAIIYALLVGFSRVFLCVHYFTDVLAGFALGTVIAVATYFLIKFIKNRIYRRKKYEKNCSSIAK